MLIITHMEISQLKWSYSALKDFENCPRQYLEIKVLKRFEKRPSKQMLYGTEVHSALEHYVKDGTPLPKNYQKYQTLLDPFVEMEGEKYPEYRMALTYEKVPCSWGAESFWVRGIADLLVVRGNTGFIVDYKTGSNRFPDPRQLQLMALMAFEHFPDLEDVNAGLLYVAHNHFITSEYHRRDKDDLWKPFNNTLTRLSLSHKGDNWLPNPTPLCKFCPVNTCEFHRE